MRRDLALGAAAVSAARVTNAQKAAAAGRAAVALAKSLVGKLLAPHARLLASHGAMMLAKANRIVSPRTAMGYAPPPSASASPDSDVDPENIAALSMLTGLVQIAVGIERAIDVLTSGGTVADAIHAESQYAHSLMGDAVGDLVSTGTAVINSVGGLIDNFAGSTPSFATTAAAIQRSAAAWSAAFGAAYKASPTATMTPAGTAITPGTGLAPGVSPMQPGYDGGGADDSGDGGSYDDPSADPNNVMSDPYADEGGSFDDGSGESVGARRA